MRVALINTPSLAGHAVSRSMAGGLGFDGGPDMLLMPLDLATMAASLRAAGVEVAIVDADPLALDEGATCDRLAATAWDVVVATVSLPTLERDAAFLAELRRRLPGARVFAKTLLRDRALLRTLLERSGADLVVHGEADLSIVELVRGRHRSGCAWLDPAAAPGEPPSLGFDAGEPVADVDALPIAARDLLPVDRYRYPLLGGPVATLQTSRGCPYPCGYYCPYPLVEGVKWRAQSAPRVLAELRSIVEGLGVRKVYFRDATFTLSEERTTEICDGIVAAGWSIDWACETRVDCLSEPLLARMRAAGCSHILVGIETGDEDTMRLREGKRGLTTSRLSAVREATRRLGIRLHFLLIAGLPTDTRQSIVDTYDLIVRHDPDTIGVTTITPYPGTPLHEQAVAEGWIDAHDWKAWGGHQVPMHTPNLSREELAIGRRMLEEAFEIARERRAGQIPRPALDDIAERHYRAAIQWAYRLDEPIARLRAVADALAREREARIADARDEDDGPRPELSVVIPTHDRRDILRKTLLAFASQTVDPDRFEVIVVDDGSSDDTAAMVEAWRGGAVRLLRQPHLGANAARNVGIRSARAPIVLLTGDDMIPGPGLVETHLRFHERNPDELAAVLGHIDWSPELEVTPFMELIVSPAGGQQFSFHTIADGVASHRVFYSSNVSLKRSLLLRQAVIFDEDFVEAAYDDTELGYRLEKQGLRLRYEPSALTYHHHPVDVARFARRQRSAGRMAVVYARKHPEHTHALRVSEAERLGPGLAPELLDRALAAAEEAERPDRSKLATLYLGAQETFETYYVRTILHPLYRHVLDLAYLCGIREALDAERAAARRAPAAHASEERFDASIVIPLFNKAELTRQCLEHLAQVTDGATFEVILVDNGSTDGTREVLDALGGDVRILRNPENLGFARACNQGAQVATGRYVVFLNNDTIPRPGWLSALVRDADEHPEVAVVGSKLLYPDGTIQHAGVAFSRAVMMPYHIYRCFPADAPCVSRRREFQVVTGACMLVRPDCFEAVGGFYEGYRNGFEDVDLCLKIRERGGVVVYQPESVLIHLESQSPGRKDHDADNARRLRERWGSYWWLADDDAIYVRDGFACLGSASPTGIQLVLRTLDDPVERGRWQIVASAQEAAQRHELAALRALLEAPEAWPRDVVVLHWASKICDKAGVPHLSPRFVRELVALHGDAARLAGGVATEARIA
ncbi:MAG TPA: glycosyltransferase [Candidatus Binatia bacterium]|nr:glycosyltransferase [Candidatus Binatia bacterium]